MYDNFYDSFFSDEKKYLYPSVACKYTHDCMHISDISRIKVRLYKGGLWERRKKNKKISARERALCQLTVCFEFQSRDDRRKEHKNYALKWYSEGK